MDDPDGVIAWLDSREGRAWQRWHAANRNGGWSRGSQVASLEDVNPLGLSCMDGREMSGPVDPRYDPCGRPAGVSRG